MIKSFLFKALNSWVTTGAGVALGAGPIWNGLKGMLDDDPSTGFIFKTFITGLGILFRGMMTRDHTKAWITPPKSE